MDKDICMKSRAIRNVIIVAFFLGALITLRHFTVNAEMVLQNSKEVIERIDQITRLIPERLGPDATDQMWDDWNKQNHELRKKRIDVISELENCNLSDAQFKPYLIMKLDDIEDCFYHLRSLPNQYESTLYDMMDDENYLKKTLATELFWSLNIYHVNTHLMHLSEQDIRQITDFELSRKEQPEAGRLMAKAIRMGHLNQDTKVKWSTWVLEQMPIESEGHQLILTRNSTKADIGKIVEYKGQDLDGNTLDLKDFRGNVVLVEYWAFWCGFCLEEIPQIKEVYHDYYDEGFRVIGVFNDYKINELKNYVKKKKIKWPQLVTPDVSKSSYFHPLAKQYGILSLPSYLLIDREGKLVRVGSSRIKDLKPVIMKLLNEE
ncbi:MAG TPA: TlpA family protein disulfide reductase [Phycisphaerales bacterium]|nr:TlpA family protein disulfide reductase [Phycisphaerales bacterium]